MATQRNMYWLPDSPQLGNSPNDDKRATSPVATATACSSMTHLPPEAAVGRQQPVEKAKVQILKAGKKLVCQVCEMTASGRFFGAFVCLPCKTFYIRCTSDPNMRFNCVYNGKCEVRGEANRSTCKACRFQKCLDVGMQRRERPEVVKAGQGQQLCEVCHDIANGIHFGVVSCEGCKKFFRRGMKEGTPYICRHRKTCVINPRTRNACRSCRLQKCLQVGMTKSDRSPNKRLKTSHDDVISAAQEMPMELGQSPPSSPPTPPPPSAITAPLAIAPAAAPCYVTTIAPMHETHGLFGSDKNDHVTLLEQQLKHMKKVDELMKMDSIRAYWAQGLGYITMPPPPSSEPHDLEAVMLRYGALCEEFEVLMDDFHADAQVLAGKVTSMYLDDNIEVMELAFKEIGSYVKLSANFIAQLPGFNTFHQSDQVNLLRWQQLPVVAVLAALRQFQPDKRAFSQFYRLRSRRIVPELVLRNSLLDFAANVHALRLQEEEAALLVNLTVLSTDWHHTYAQSTPPSQPELIEVERHRTVASLHNFLRAKGHVERPVARIVDIFALLPEIRRLGALTTEVLHSLTIPGNRREKWDSWQ